MRFTTEVNISRFKGLGKWEKSYGMLTPFFGEHPILFLADNLMEESTLNKLNFLLNREYNVIVVSVDHNTPIADDRITYIQLLESQYQDFVFESLNGIYQVVTNGGTSYWLAYNLSQQHEIELVKDLEDLPTMGRDIVLVQSFDGLGDQLMLIPTIKTHAMRGRAVDIYVRTPEAFANLNYIRRILTGEDYINPSRYKAIYNSSFKLSCYEEEYCCQHRIKATAECCGLRGEELVLDRPEICLTIDEIDRGRDLIQKGNGKQKIVMCFESNDIRRSYPRKMRQDLIDLFNKHFEGMDIITVGDCDFNYDHCINLVKQTTIRELFAIISQTDLAITIDSSVLHIAGALNIPNILLPSTVRGEWRSYPSTTIIEPPVSCYPCNDRENNCELFCGGFLNPQRSCLEKINQKLILREARWRLLGS